jgi:hypothetical protein
MILGPQGELLAEPQVGGEGMVVAEIDLSRSIEQKQIHDIVGSYNRFDVFRLTVDQRPNRPIAVIREEDRSRRGPYAGTGPAVAEKTPLENCPPGANGSNRNPIPSDEAP